MCIVITYIQYVINCFRLKKLKQTFMQALNTQILSKDGKVFQDSFQLYTVILLFSITNPQHKETNKNNFSKRAKKTKRIFIHFYVKCLVFYFWRDLRQTCFYSVFCYITFMFSAPFQLIFVRNLNNIFFQFLCGFSFVI